MPRLNWNSETKPSPSGSFESVGRSRKMKCCSTASLNGASLTTTLAGRPPGSSGKFTRPKRGRAAERRGDVPDRGEMAHLVDRDLQDRAAPARGRVGFGGGQSFLRRRS